MEFNEREKELIKKLVGSSSTVYYVSVYDFFIQTLEKDTALVCYVDYFKTFFSYRKKTFENQDAELKKAYFDIVEIVNLFHKLETKSYISRIRRVKERDFDIDCFVVVHSKNRKINEKPIQTEKDKQFQYHISLGENEKVVISDDKWYDERSRVDGTKEYLDEIYDSYVISEQYDVYELLDSYVHINQSLIELQSNNFKTNEEQQLAEAQKQKKIAIGAVILSVCAIIASIFVPRSTPSTINYSQFDSIQTNQSELINILRELKINQIDNDSLIKELNSVNQSIDEILNSLNEIKKSKSMNTK